MGEHCSICKEVGLSKSGAGTGYGYDRRLGEDKPICYLCCGLIEAWDMTETGRGTLYLSGFPLFKGDKDSGDYKVSNWPNSLQCRVLHVSKSYGRGFGGEYQHHDVSFVGPDGARWYGRQQGDNQILHCRRTKVGY